MANGVAPSNNASAKPKSRSKGEVYKYIAEKTGLKRKDIVSVFDNMAGLMKKDLKATGLFQVPGLLKVKVVKKPATKARMGTNPFTGQEMMFKAKPARKVVKAQPMKAVKMMV